jgi:hypothetical protein
LLVLIPFLSPTSISTLLTLPIAKNALKYMVKELLEASEDQIIFYY